MADTVIFVYVNTKKSSLLRKNGIFILDESEFICFIELDETPE